MKSQRYGEIERVHFLVTVLLLNSGAGDVMILYTCVYSMQEKLEFNMREITVSLKF